MVSSLYEQIRSEAASSGGWLAFDGFMELALHHPTDGYYAAPMGPHGPFGKLGDFVTAPMLGPWLALALARRFEGLRQEHAQVPAQGPAQDAGRSNQPGGLGIREFGPGTGQLAADLLKALWARDALPISYQLIERSAGLRAIQMETIRDSVASLGRAALEVIMPRMDWPLDWPTAADAQFHGLVVANEVADTLAVKRFEWRGHDRAWEWGVVEDGSGLAWEPREAGGALLEAILRRHAQIQVPLGPWRPGHLGEWCPGLAPWGRTVMESIRWGDVIVIDYGYERLELDHPDRSGGTLAGHLAHRRVDDPLLWLREPGRMDLTAHVDFSDLAQAARAGGATDVALQTQAAWCLDQGMLEAAQDMLFEDGVGAPPSDPSRIRALSNLQTLLSDNEMGQRFLVLTASQRQPASPA
ncbi:MAG: SAM-dependent methyltransferase [Burkholderiaceae bacterium]|nr:SAM-dependent methyltransferase [Burkholderiaceae bacterium]